MKSMGILELYVNFESKVDADEKVSGLQVGGSED